MRITREIIESLGIPFYYIPASKENRAEAEQKQLQLVKEYEVDAIILARYMQILTQVRSGPPTQDYQHTSFILPSICRGETI